MAGDTGNSVGRKSNCGRQRLKQPAKQAGTLLRRLPVDDLQPGGNLALLGKPGHCRLLVADLIDKPEVDVKKLLDERGLNQVEDQGAIEALVKDVLAKNQKQVEQYRDGNDKLFGFFVGQVMKASQGKANPQTVNEVLKKHLA